jgi:hypothetical protein
LRSNGSWRWRRSGRRILMVFRSMFSFFFFFILCGPIKSR